MADPLVQNQQPLTQAANQQPVYQRGADPYQIQAFLMQDHYKNKIRTILGEESTEASEIYKMEGLTWKEKYAEAKTRTNPAIDEMDRFIIDEISVDELDKYYMANSADWDYKTRSVYKATRSQLKTIEANKLANTQDMTEQERDEWTAKMDNQQHIDKGEDTFNVITDAIELNLEENILTKEIKDEEGKITTATSTAYTPEMTIELNRIIEEFNKDLNYWNYDEETGKRNPRGDIEQIQKSLGVISKNLNFPKKFEMYNEDIDDYIEYDFEKDPDAAQRNWVRNQMSKIKTAREGLNKVRVFPTAAPTGTQIEETWENVKDTLEKYENPRGDKYNTTDGTLNWDKPYNTNKTIDVGKYQVNSKWIVKDRENFSIGQDGKPWAVWNKIQDAMKQDIPNWDDITDDERMEIMATNDALNTKISKLIFENTRGLDEWSSADSVRQEMGIGAGRQRGVQPEVRGITTAPPKINLMNIFNKPNPSGKNE